MLEIGQKVSYIRQNNTKTIEGQPNPEYGKVVEGEGIVIAVLLDHTMRKMVQIDDKGSRFNIDYACVNPPEDFKVKFTKLGNDIDKLSKEGSAEQKRVITEYNSKMDELRDELLGKPMEI